MKKKHLKSLSSLEKWLGQRPGIESKVMDSLQIVKTALLALPDDELKLDHAVLPPPDEIKNDPDMIAIFSDGGCRGNPGPGACAYVIQDSSGLVLSEGVEFEPLTTNNKMELNGALLALLDLKHLLAEKNKDAMETKVKVITDSKYVVEGMKSWVEGWKNRGWKKADNKPPENMEIWKDLDHIRNQFLTIEWMWVKGHGGHPQNEYCDRKANEAMDENIA